MQDLKNQLLEQYIIWVTNQEECDAANALLCLGFKVLYFGDRGWSIFSFHNFHRTIKDTVVIKKINSINIGSQYICINKIYIPIYSCNNLKLTMSNG